MKLQARVNLLKNQTGNIKAFASVTLGGEYVINDLRVMDGAKGLWVANPSKKGKDDKYADIFFPITKKARQDLFDCVLKEYEKKVAGESEAGAKVENAVEPEKETTADEVPF